MAGAMQQIIELQQRMEAEEEERMRAAIVAEAMEAARKIKEEEEARLAQEEAEAEAKGGEGGNGGSRGNGAEAGATATGVTIWRGCLRQSRAETGASDRSWTGRRARRRLRCAIQRGEANAA